MVTAPIADFTNEHYTSRLWLERFIKGTNVVMVSLIRNLGAGLGLQPTCRKIVLIARILRVWSWVTKDNQ